MATYIIGDVQGCYAELIALLDKIHFNPDCDRLGFIGDLVNRGPQSLKTLRFIKSLDDPLIVLGNHDICLLGFGFGVIEYEGFHTLNDIMAANDREELLHWLRQQRLVYHDPAKNYLMVHAGIPPQWSAAQAQTHAAEIEAQLHGDNYLDYLTHVFARDPFSWSDDLQGYARARYITNALTRMRFCQQNGELDLHIKTATHPNPDSYKPWFDWRHDDPQLRVLFGHWASLNGRCDKPNYFALDTGCVWGNTLTAIRVEDQQLFSVGRQS